MQEFQVTGLYKHTTEKNFENKEIQEFGQFKDCLIEKALLKCIYETPPETAKISSREVEKMFLKKECAVSEPQKKI